MEWIAAIAFVLMLLWVAKRREAETPIPPPSLPDPRKLMAHQMLRMAATAEREGRYNVAQQMRLKAAWLRTYPPLGQDDPPPEFDPDQYKHLMLVEDIRRQSEAVLAGKTGSYARCTFKPAGLLPFPKAYTNQAMRLLLALGRGEQTSRHLEPDAISGDDLEAMERNAQLLQAFIDVSPDDLPTEPDENLRYGQQHQALRLDEGR